MSDVTPPSTPVRPTLTQRWPETPKWAPLERLLGDGRCADFMAMGEMIQNKIVIYLYKHKSTRRYLNLDNDGNAYRFNNGAYDPITLTEAIHHAFS